MAYPTVKAGTTHVDAGSDSPSQARSDIKQNIDNVNALIDHFNGTGPISIQDNEIKATRSNDDLMVSASGTGEIFLDSHTHVGATLTSNPTGVGSNAIGSRLNYENLTDTPGTREYALNRTAMWKTDGADSSSSSARYRVQDTLSVDLNASLLTSTSTAAGAQIQHLLELKTSASGDGSTVDSRLGNASANAAGVYFPSSGGNNSVIQVDDAYAFRAFGLSTPASGDTVKVSDAYAYYYGGFTKSGSGTTTIDNEYFLFTADDDAKSRVGTLERYQEDITTSGSTSGSISIDANTAPVHIVNQNAAATYTFTNLSAGQSVTLIIKTTATNCTATFTSDGSTKVKFPDGDPVLSQSTGAIDIVVVFNDGTDFLGAITQNYTTG